MASKRKEGGRRCSRGGVCRVVLGAALLSLFIWLHTQMIWLQHQQQQQQQQQQPHSKNIMEFRGGSGSGSGGGSDKKSVEELQQQQKQQRKQAQQQYGRKAAQQQKQQRADNKGSSFFYETSIIPPGCRHYHIPKNRDVTCGKVMDLIYDKNNKSLALALALALHQTAEQNPDCAAVCLKASNNTTTTAFTNAMITTTTTTTTTANINNKFWYLDQIITSQNNMILQAVTHYLPCIPIESRFPNNATTLLPSTTTTTTFNVTKFMHTKWPPNKRSPSMLSFSEINSIRQRQRQRNINNNKNNSNNNRMAGPGPGPVRADDLRLEKGADVYTEFNPSLALLSMTQQQMLAPRFPTARYVATFRISGDFNCYPHGTKQLWNVHQTEVLKFQNYLGIALLNEQLHLVPHSDVVIDLEQQLGLLPVEHPTMPTDNVFVDYRVYNFDNLLYLNVNGPPVFILPFHLELFNTNQSTSTSSTTSPSRGIHLDIETLLNHQPGKDPPIPLENKFSSGGGLRIVLETTPFVLVGLPSGKNFAFFQTPKTAATTTTTSHTKNKSSTAPLPLQTVWAEIVIYRSRLLQRIRLDQVNVVDFCTMWKIMYPVSLYPKRGSLPCTENNKAANQGGTIPDSARLDALYRRQAVLLPDTDAPIKDNHTSNNNNNNITVTTKMGQHRQLKQLLPNQQKEEKLVHPSFATIDELWFSAPVFKETPHGGACCITIPKSLLSSSSSLSLSSGVLLVGVGHSKVPYRHWMSKPENAARLEEQPHHQYVSFFYAFDPVQDPYRILARTGYFCLPHGISSTSHRVYSSTSTSTSSSRELISHLDKETLAINAYHVLTRHRPLRLKGHVFDCPQISFVSGIVQHATNDNQVIISYGINDCTPRMIVMDKRDIAKLLFQGQ